MLLYSTICEMWGFLRIWWKGNRCDSVEFLPFMSIPRENSFFQRIRWNSNRPGTKLSLSRFFTTHRCLVIEKIKLESANYTNSRKLSFLNLKQRKVSKTKKHWKESLIHHSSTNHINQRMLLECEPKIAQFSLEKLLPFPLPHSSFLPFSQKPFVFCSTAISCIHLESFEKSPMKSRVWWKVWIMFFHVF